jgi:hypothetical protein
MPRGEAWSRPIKNHHSRSKFPKRPPATPNQTNNAVITPPVREIPLPRPPSEILNCPSLDRLSTGDLASRFFSFGQPAQSTKLPDGQITSDFQKSCQAQESKIFLFSTYPNQFTSIAIPSRSEGRWPSSQRGTGSGGREVRETKAHDAYGEVVWS